MIAIIFLITMWDYSYDCDIFFAYDNNIFTYSQTYIDDFMNQMRPYRFPFETYDDFYTEPNIDIRLRKKFLLEHTTTLNLGVNVRHYTINHQKDFQRLVVGLRQSFGSWAIKSTYRIVPRYIIRYYRDPAGSNTDYVACEVAYHTITGKITLPTMKCISPAIFYDYSIDNYVETFEIYDAHAHSFGMQTAIDLNKKFSIDVGYDFKMSFLDTTADAGYDNDESVPDGAYFQQSFSTELQVQGIITLPLIMIINYRYSFRNYRTSDPDDRWHFGRQDHQHTISIGTDVKVRTGFFLCSEYSHGFRKAISQVFPEIAMIKDFTKDRFEAGIRFYY